METIWKFTVACLGLLFLELCNGLPLNLENTAADSHTQFLTGLIGILLTVSTVVFLAGCICCQRRNGFKEFRDSPVVISSVSNLDRGLVNPTANGEFTIFTPLSPPNHNNNVFLADRQAASTNCEDYAFGDARLRAWFGPDEKDFPRTRLKYIRELGRGWFGEVVEGAAQNVHDEGWTPVAVRILEATAGVAERAAFLHDALIYRDKHPNILGLVGRCLDGVPFLILQELCPEGDLKQYLRNHGKDSEHQIPSEYVLLWCYQLTSALKHLHMNKLTHPDIAARNCMLSSDLQLKLGDYGLSVTKYPEDYYQGAPGVPVRWCAPESLVYTSTTIQPKQVTFEANVWSLGITIWEICEYGEQPYKNLSDDEVISQVLGPPKQRLQRPTNAAIYTDYMYRLIQLCWTTQESRPSVQQIEVMVSDLLEVCKNTNSSTQSPSVSADDFDRRWDSLKPNQIIKTDNVGQADDDMDDNGFIKEKDMLPSLNNLLDDGSSVQMDSWLENVTVKMDDNDINEEKQEDKPSPSDLKYKDGSKVEFKLCPMSQRVARSAEVLNDRMSSESETEDENWKRKIERGAYSEKVRQKSRSVTDLMVLTHIDCSESDSETPLPSLDYKANLFKNVRYVPRQNLENVSLMFGSEGNLLSVQNTFQEELQRLREEQKDSLLFVPENINQDISSATSRRILEELNGIADIKPANQVFNVFSVTVTPKYAFNELPRLEQSCESVDFRKSLSSENSSIETKNLEEETIDDCVKSCRNNGINDEHDKNHTLTCCDSNTTESLLLEMNNINNTNEVSDGKILAETSDVALSNEFIMQTSVEDQKHVSLADENVQEGQSKDDICSSSNTNSYATCTEDSLPNIENNCDQENLNEDEKTVGILKATSTNEAVEIYEEPVITQDCGQLDESYVFTLDLHRATTDLISNEKEWYKQLYVVEANCNKTSNQNCAEDFEKTLETDQVLEENFALEKDLEDKCTETRDNKYLDIKLETQRFLENERHYLQGNNFEIRFDLSENQQSIQPSSLTHSMVFTSSPFVKKHLENSLRQSDFTSLNLFENESEAVPHEDNCTPNNFTYSIETWDNFLEKTLESQEECFSSFNSEPQSILFVENNPDANESTDVNVTYVVEEPAENECQKTDKPEVKVLNDENVKPDESKDNTNWETGGGWFLHPQSNEDVSGQMEINSTSYVGFSMDDEIMAAIRNELLQKLPHAQGSSSEKVVENEEWDSEERNEVFIRYNVYNTPLSPIPEESFTEPCSKQSTPRCHQSESDDSEWSGAEGRISPIEDVAEGSCSPQRGHLNRHTPSQDSCCSNDTLFNLEELNEPEKEQVATVIEVVSDTKVAEATKDEKQKTFDGNVEQNENQNEEVGEDVKETHEAVERYNYLTDFLNNERKMFCEPVEISEVKLNFLNKVEAPPLPSPEDKPWKQLPASLLTFNHIVSNNDKLTTVKNLKNASLIDSDDVTNDYVNIQSKTIIDYSDNDCNDYVNIENNKNADYVNATNGFEGESEDIYSSVNDVDDIGVLADIRFTGPGDGQLMSTSFSESNELGEEQGWDSGSDTRSSSSGEFIWKEGEHEASVKALHASSFDAVSEEVKPLEDIQEESSETCSSDDDGEGPEFVPSAWDKYATPTKSALRSPEKTDKKRKSKGVWFKKQKYHCIYEYPREPQSPTLHSYDLWTASPDYNSLDWDLEGDPYVATVYDDDDSVRRFSDYYKLKSTPSYTLDPSFDDFYVSSSSKPFDVAPSLTSQFFPGQTLTDEWPEPSQQTSENATPDSGVEDESVPTKRTVPPLKILAATVAKKQQQSKTRDALGGLRHTRNKLKLDLPPSPSAFTSNKSFLVEVPVDAVVNREVPSFTTFGKSRFLVQHVDTPECERNEKDVSFEAIPYKPLMQGKVEVVTGEASLLDSADEDSGIESSTLERRKVETAE